MIFKEKFERLSAFEKLEIYVIFSCLFYGWYLFHSHYVNDSNRSSKELQYELKKMKNEISTITKRSKTYNDIEILDLVDQMIQKHNLLLIQSNITKQKIRLQIHGKFNSIYNFLYQSSAGLEVVSFSIDKLENDTLALQVDISKKIYLPQNRSQIAFIHNPFSFIDKSSKKKPLKKEYGYKLNAIVKNSVSINGKWYELNEKIHHYKITTISLNHVVLKDLNGSKELILKVFEDE